MMNREINFHIYPRDFLKNSVTVPAEIMQALIQANTVLSNMSQGQYSLVLTRGFIEWGFWRRLKAHVGGALFSIFFRENAQDIQKLFSSNGHDDGFSVDVVPYDNNTQQVFRFLPWYNVFISRATADRIWQRNKPVLTMVDAAMKQSGFVAHEDPREKLQIHYRCVLK